MQKRSYFFHSRSTLFYFQYDRINIRLLVPMFFLGTCSCVFSIIVGFLLVCVLFEESSLNNVCEWLCLNTLTFLARFRQDHKLPSKVSHFSNTFHSSVFCTSDTDGHRICNFKNICYFPPDRQFLFILSNDSVVHGIKTKKDLQLLELSSIPNHNQFFLNLAVVLPENAMLYKDIIFIDEPIYILKRFKWDNMMHVIHDDLLPLYNTYLHICEGNVEECVSKFRLAFVDKGEPNASFTQWYNLFSYSEPLHLESQYTNSIHCFDEARVGLLRSTVWFQYGFSIPQGPVNNIDADGDGILVRQFTKFVTNGLHIPLPGKSYSQNKKTLTSVIFNRRTNRKVLNENSLVKAINKVCAFLFPQYQQVEIIVMDLSVNTSASVLETLLQTDLVVGMHGAAMILNIFLPPGSAVLELFPLGIIPEHVSFLKAISDKPGMDLHYGWWRNMEEKHSIPHPDALPLMGGIGHLSEAEQNEIVNLLPIPAVKCCHNPAYLFRMFQDTTVDIPSFKSKLQETLKRKKQSAHFQSVESIYKSRWWYPAAVSYVNCVFNSTTLHVDWKPAVNVEGTEHYYEITIVSKDVHREFTTKETYLNILWGHFERSIHTHWDLWVKCVAGGIESLDTHLTCVLP